MTTSSNNKNGARQTRDPAWVRDALDVLGISAGSNEEADFRRELAALLMEFRIGKQKAQNPKVSKAIGQARAIARRADKFLSAYRAVPYATLVEIEASTPLTEDDPWPLLGDRDTDRQEVFIRLLERVQAGALDAVAALERDRKSGKFAELDPEDWISPRPDKLGRQPKKARNGLIEGLLRLFEAHYTGDAHFDEQSRIFLPLADDAQAELKFVRTVLSALGEDRLDDAGTRELIQSLR